MDGWVRLENEKTEEFIVKEVKYTFIISPELVCSELLLQKRVFFPVFSGVQ